MHHTLREDPRRRFTYAFTIENTMMRLWYASRSDILVSTAFDIMKVNTTSLSSVEMLTDLVLVIPNTGSILPHYDVRQSVSSRVGSNDEASPWQ